VLGLREAAKKTHLARGWLALMIDRGIIPHSVSSAGQPRVRLADIKAHRQEIKGMTTQDRLKYLLTDWTRYGDIRQAMPSLSASRLREMLKNVQERTYANYGKVGREYKIIEKEKNHDKSV
jgi:hypothetical protein